MSALGQKQRFVHYQPNVRFARWSQRVDATPVANLSSGDLTTKAFWAVRLAGGPLCLDKFADTSTGWSPSKITF